MLSEWHDRIREEIKNLEPWQNRVGVSLVPEFRGRVVRLNFVKEGKADFLVAIYRPNKVTRFLVDYWLTYSVIQKGSVNVATDAMARGMRFLEKYPEQFLRLLEINTSTRNNKFWNHLARRMLECL
jgi:hypothetical protein